MINVIRQLNKLDVNAVQFCCWLTRSHHLQCKDNIKHKVNHSIRCNLIKHQCKGRVYIQHKYTLSLSKITINIRRNCNVVILVLIWGAFGRDRGLLRLFEEEGKVSYRSNSTSTCKAVYVGVQEVCPHTLWAELAVPELDNHLRVTPWNSHREGEEARKKEPRKRENKEEKCSVNPLAGIIKKKEKREGGKHMEGEGEGEGEGKTWKEAGQRRKGGQEMEKEKGKKWVERKRWEASSDGGRQQHEGDSHGGQRSCRSRGMEIWRTAPSLVALAINFLVIGLEEALTFTAAPWEQHAFTVGIEEG